MKLIIEIPEDLYENARGDTYTSLDELDAIRAIQDGTELITCKECVWYKVLPIWGGIEEDTVCDALVNPAHRNPDDFCSRATRREDVSRHIRIEKLSE